MVAAVILTWNQRDDTLRCLRSLAEATYPALTLILVDNASDDGTVDAVRAAHPDVCIVESPQNAGVAGGRNLGIRYANEHLDYKYLLILDNDTVVEPGFLEPLIESLEQHPEAGVVSPKIYILDEEKILDEAGGCLVNLYTGSTERRGHREPDNGQYDTNETPDTELGGGCTLSRREVIEATGGLDEAFNPYGFEDLDYSLRAKAAGWTIRFVPTSVIHHRGSKAGFDSYTAAYASLKGKHMRRFMKRHASPFQWLCFNALLPLLGIRTLTRELLRGNPGAALALVRGYLKK